MTGSRFPLRWVLRILASLVALGLLAWWLPTDELLSAMRSVPPFTWPVAIAAYLASHLVGVAKWRLLINAAGAGVRRLHAAQAYYWGLFGSLFLPSIVGGDVIRAGVAMPLSRSRAGVVLGSLVDRAQDVIGLGMLAGIGAILAPRALDDGSRRIFLALVALVAASTVAGLAALRFFPARRVPFRLRRLLVRIRAGIRATASRPDALLAGLIAGMTLQTLLVALNWELGRQIGLDIPFHVWLFVWPLAKIAGLAPITQGGIGVREAAQAALFVPFGVSAVNAVAVGLVWEAIIITGGLLAGGIAILLRRYVAQAEAAPAAVVARRLP